MLVPSVSDKSTLLSILNAILHRGELSNTAKTRLDHLFNGLAENMPAVDLIIYILTNTETVFERSRTHHAQLALPYAYIDTLQRMYNQWLLYGRWGDQLAPLLVIDGERTGHRGRRLQEMTLAFLEEIRTHGRLTMGSWPSQVNIAGIDVPCVIPAFL